MGLHKFRGIRQKGSLYKSGESWKGRYRSYSGIKGKGREISFTIGRVSDMPEAEAQKILTSVVEAHKSKLPILRRIGTNSALAINSKDIEVREKPLPGAIGSAAELIVCADLLSKGIDVFRALYPQSSCDLVMADETGRLLRLEVKGATLNPQGRVTCDVTRNSGNFDLIAFVFSDGTILYRKPEELVTGSRPWGADDTPAKSPAEASA